MPGDLSGGFVLGHHHNFFEEAINGLSKAGDLVKSAVVMSCALFGLHAAGSFPAGVEEFAFGVVLEKVGVDATAVLEICLLENLADALEGDGERLQNLGLVAVFWGVEATT